MHEAAFGPPFLRLTQLIWSLQQQANKCKNSTKTEHLALFIIRSHAIQVLIFSSVTEGQTAKNDTKTRQQKSQLVRVQRPIEKLKKGRIFCH